MYKQAFLEITSRHQNYVQIFTDGSKVDEKVAAAAVSSVDPSSPFSCRLRDHCSIYTAELQAIPLDINQPSFPTPLTLPNMSIKFGKKNGMKLVWYLINFMKFYRNFQTNCYPFVLQGKKTLF